MTRQEDEEIPHETALMWLNGLRGKLVAVDVAVDCGSASATVLTWSGTLRRDGDEAVEVAQLDPTGRREDIVGLYTVDKLQLDFSNPELPCDFRIEHHHFDLRDGGDIPIDRLVIDAGNVAFRVVEIRERTKGGDA